MSIATRLYIVFTQEVNHLKKNPRYLMEEWQTNFKVQALFTMGIVFLQKYSLFNKRYSQGTAYHVINQLGSPDRRELTNRSSMSNQEPKKNKPYKSLPLEYVLIT